jgi:hypothetical protein
MRWLDRLTLTFVAWGTVDRGTPEPEFEYWVNLDVRLIVQ